MTGKFMRGAAALAMVASFSMAAAPALAHDWGNRWGDDWRYRRHHDRVDGGDILAGILIIGGIAAIASAASKSSKQRREQQERRYPDEPYRQDQPSYGQDNRPEWREGTGIDGAVNRCIDEVNRGRAKVGDVDSVNRDADGWRVAGSTSDNGTFSCVIDRDGRIRNVNVNGRAI